MKVIIAGSRTFTNYENLLKIIKESEFEITEVVSGGAAGADTLGEQFAKENNIPIKQFLADWNNLDVNNCDIRTNRLGKPYNGLAGFNRNLEMAKYADALIAVSINNSPGTRNMIGYAKENGLKIYSVKF